MSARHSKHWIKQIQKKEGFIIAPPSSSPSGQDEYKLKLYHICVLVEVVSPPWLTTLVYCGLLGGLFFNLHWEKEKKKDQMFLISVTWEGIPQVAEQGGCKYFLARCCGNKQYALSSSQKLQGASICTLAELPGVSAGFDEAGQTPPLSTAAKGGLELFPPCRGAWRSWGGDKGTSSHLPVPQGSHIPPVAPLWGQFWPFGASGNSMEVVSPELSPVLTSQAGKTRSLWDRQRKMSR